MKSGEEIKPTPEELAVKEAEQILTEAFENEIIPVELRPADKQNSFDSSDEFPA
jgi:hypothetical protein